MTFKEMTPDNAKQWIKKYICTKETVVYFSDEQDFTVFQNAYLEISPNNLTQVMKSIKKINKYYDICTIQGNHTLKKPLAFSKKNFTTLIIKNYFKIL